MSLWTDLPASVRNSGALDQVRPLLDNLTGSDQGTLPDEDGVWHNYKATGTWPGEERPEGA